MKRTFEFTKEFKKSSTTIAPGVRIKGEFTETKNTLSLKGSKWLRFIPKDSLEECKDKILPATKKRSKKGV